MNPQTSSLAQITSQILYPLVQAAETRDPNIVKVRVLFVIRLYYVKKNLSQLIGSK